MVVLYRKVLYKPLYILTEIIQRAPSLVNELDLQNASEQAKNTPKYQLWDWAATDH
ncbi:hypothetical protein MASR2M66_26710 [Chloroflexota bacterium]